MCVASGELYHADSMPLVDSLKYTTPMGREVFGGGGIAQTSSWPGTARAPAGG